MVSYEFLPREAAMLERFWES